MRRQDFLSALGTSLSSAWMLPVTDELAAAGGMCNVRQYGAAGDGRIDDTGAIERCVAEARESGAPVLIPAGVYRISRTLWWDSVPFVWGVPGHTVLRPDASVATALTLSTGKAPRDVTPGCIVSGLTVDGRATSGAVGLALGPDYVSGRIVLHDCEIRSFRGVGAVGVSIEKAVGCCFNRLLARGNTENVVCNSPDGSTPTTVSFFDSNIREAMATGLRITHGYALHFVGCVFESNGGHGVHLVARPSDTILLIRLTGCWFENNWAGAPDRISKFSMEADGTAKGSTCTFRLDGCLWNGNPRSERALRVKGGSNFVVDGCVFPNVEATVDIDATSHGRFVNFPRHAGEFISLVRSAAPAGAVLAGDEAPHGVSQSNGDGDITLVHGKSAPTQFFELPLSRDRRVVLDNSRAVDGALFRIVRAGAGPGALDVGPGVALIPPASTAWMDIQYSAASRAWKLIAYGPLP
jgi:hypothetical protein